MRKRVRKKHHKRYLADVVYEISISSYWRKQLFKSTEYRLFRIDKENMSGLFDTLKNNIKRYGLKYYISTVPYLDTKGCEDWDSDLIYFKFVSVEFPHIMSFSANNPKVI